MVNWVCSAKAQIVVLDSNRGISHGHLNNNLCWTNVFWLIFHPLEPMISRHLEVRFFFFFWWNGRNAKELIVSFLLLFTTLALHVYKCMWFRAKHDSAHLIQNAFVMFSHRVNEEENYIIKIHFFLIIWCSAMIDKSAVGLGVSGRGCIAILTYVSLGVWWVCFFEWNILPLPLNYRMGVVMIQLKSLLLSRDAPHHHQWRSSQSSYAECNSHDFRQRPIVHFWYRNYVGFSW